MDINLKLMSKKKKNRLKIDIKLDIVPLKKIQIWTNNPRMMSEDQSNGLRVSLQKFGYVSLLVVNKTGLKLIAGHQRYKILKKMGVEKIPVIIVDISKEQAKVMSLTLNNEYITGRWTDALLSILNTIKQKDVSAYINLKLDRLRESSGVFNTIIENYIKEKELDENLPTTFKCPECNYAW